MLRNAKVEYMAWAKTALSGKPRVSLLDSGIADTLRSIDVELDALLEAEQPLWGDAGVRHALAGRYGVPEDDVFAAQGTSMALFLACAAVLAPGDVVLVETPTYEPLWRVPEALGARVIRFPRGHSEGWTVDPERVLSRWTDGTRMVLVTDLHNPTGREAGDDALRTLAGELERRDAVLLVDEVYRDFRPGPVGTARRLGQNVIAVGSLTKVYGLSRIRAGWLFAPPGAVERIHGIINVLNVVDPAPIQPLFRRALAAADRLRSAALDRASEAWGVVERWQRSGKLPQVVKPTAGLVAWGRLPEGLTGTAFAERLLEAEGVALTPGRFFGDDTGFRLAFGQVTPDLLASALDSLSNVLESYGFPPARGA